MRNLLAFMAAAALTVAGLGWYLGWYRIQTAPASSGHHDVHIDINTEKFQDDIHHAEQEILDKANEQIQKDKDKTNSQPAPTPPGNTASLLPPR